MKGIALMLKTAPILLIENNPKDAENILSILESLEENFRLFHLRTTREAQEYLRNNNDIQPWLILLGLRSESPEGFEFLKKIKTDDNLRKIPVVIMASSNEQYHVLESFKLGVAGYIVKSQDITELEGIISTIMRYWNLCELPPAGG